VNLLGSLNHFAASAQVGVKSDGMMGQMTGHLATSDTVACWNNKFAVIRAQMLRLQSRCQG